MINADSENIIALIKQQATLFLLDGEEFYPFGTYIDMSGQVKPIGAYLEDNNPSTSHLISMLENYLKQKIDDKTLKIGVIAINVAISENGSTQDAIEMRLYKPNIEIERRYLKYHIKDKQVEFF
jgi:hypothetical protein